MHINPDIFRGYDVRGLVGTDLNPEVAEHFGKAFGTYLKRRGVTRCVVGRDARATSPAYAAEIIRGLQWAGMDIIDIGMTLVGTFYWSQYFLERQGGVYISASHNPPEFNGFKFANGFSETLVTEGIQELRRLTAEEDYEQSPSPGACATQDVREAYYADILRRIPLAKKFRVLV